MGMGVSSGSGESVVCGSRAVGEDLLGSELLGVSGEKKRGYYGGFPIPKSDGVDRPLSHYHGISCLARASDMDILWREVVRANKVKEEPGSLSKDGIRLVSKAWRREPSVSYVLALISSAQLCSACFIGLLALKHGIPGSIHMYIWGGILKVMAYLHSSLW